MAVRVTDDEVKEIIDTTLTDLTPFILVASQQVDRISTAGTLGAAVLKEIERWLAAHAVAMRDKRTSKDSVLDSSHTYEGKTGTGLDFTRYGQQAKLLDTTGTLAKLSKQKAAMTYLGGTVSASGKVEV